MTSRVALVLGALAMFLAVACGAFGAHALRARLDPQMLAVWQTGVQYQAWHALALLVVGLLLQRAGPSRRLGWAGILFAVGIVLFSGSLYLLALTGVRLLGAVTPLGGVAFLAGWLVLAVAAWQGG